MNWNIFCLYALMCFTTPTPELNSEKELCSYYKSEDVDKKSLVLDVSKLKVDPMKPDDCLELSPFHTILVHAPQHAIDDRRLPLSAHSIQYDHLISLNDVMILDSCPGRDDSIMKRTSLTVYNNNNILEWKWLKCTQFKHIRIDNCYIGSFSNDPLDKLIFSKYLLTLTLVSVDNLYPWDNMNYRLAPNLRELSINYCFLGRLTKKDGSFDKLKRLNLENNKISYLEEDIFHSMPSLEEVNLQGNKLVTFSHAFNSIPRRVLLDGNDLKGDMKTCQYLQTAPFVQFSKKNLICSDKSGWREL